MSLCYFKYGAYLQFRIAIISNYVSFKKHTSTGKQVEEEWERRLPGL